VFVKVTDRIGERFGKTRIDLTIAAFKKLDNPVLGLIPIEVEEVKPEETFTSNER
jgi:rare lipoprotein A (peptidoglycan hydrolase)